jgi:hypothetical protein
MQVECALGMDGPTPRLTGVKDGEEISCLETAEKGRGENLIKLLRRGQN